MLLPNAGKEWYNGVEVITLLKVFLVEDECVVREGLRDCIDWERYGFEFCGDAPDGELALPQIRKLRPDILITDIKMPFMDGLALSKLVCAELPETRIILISGHNDFEFAQEAIEIGVEQYLLKPVTKASLLKTLEDVSRKIDEEREQKDYLRRFQQEGPEYEQFARRKFFEQITSGTLRVSEIYEQAKKLQIDIDAEGYTVILLTLQSRGTAEYSQTLAERLEELMAYLLRYGEYLLFRCNLMTYCVIVKGSAAGLDEAVRRCLENIERRCGGDEALAWYAAVSEPVARLSELPGCYASAHTILSYRHLLPERHVLTADVLQSRSAGRSRRSTRSTPARPTPPLSAISYRPVCARRSRILYRNILRPSETRWIRCSSGSMCCWSCASAPSARPRASAIRRRNSCARLPPGRSCRRTADARRWKKLRRASAPRH